ncbi:hypothetical protein EST38_g14252, partial [Candolleomyces aberdarensis]
GSSSVLSDVAACIDAKVDSEASDAWNHLVRMNEFAKNMFIQQPNRFFVRSMLVTEHRAQLFHFDRSGVQYTPLFNIHDDPETFIHLITALCATEERILGFDDSIQWRMESNGARTSGTLSTVGPDDTIATYDLVIDEPPLVPSRLRGRGTTCWAVRNRRAERFIVKDYWVTDDQMREFELLDGVKGLPGVCQMVSYEDSRAQTKDFRGDLTALADDAFPNRTSVRIVMKAYGPTIEKFKSIEQLLAALRDAIAAHQALLSRNIIHRDISPNNILLGPDNAEEGERGVIIDLDVALRSAGASSQTVINVKKGTLMFQSRMVLRSYNLIPAFIPLYAYLDDLEAFFWVFAYLVLTYKPNVHEIRAAIEPGWRVVYEDLFLGFRDFVREVGDDRDRLLYKGQTKLPNGTLAPNRFAPVLAKVDEHYARVIGLFDAALEKLKGSYLNTEPPKSPQITSPLTSSSTNSGSASEFSSVISSVSSRVPKRRSEEADLDDGLLMVAKRRYPSHH